MGAVSEGPQSRVAPFAAEVKLDPEEGVAAGDEPDELNGSKTTVVFVVAIDVRDGAMGATLKYPFTTPNPALVMAVAGDIADLAAPVPLALT